MMKDFSTEKSRDWMSPAMYTHVCGYKFCIGVNGNGRLGESEKSIQACVLTMPGLYDRQLCWPVKIAITLQLINQQGGENAACTASNTWNRPTKSYVLLLKRFERIRVQHKGGSSAFLRLSEVDNYLVNDSLYFDITRIEII